MDYYQALCQAPRKEHSCGLVSAFPSRLYEFSLELFQGSFYWDATCSTMKFPDYINKAAVYKQSSSVLIQKCKLSIENQELKHGLSNVNHPFPVTQPNLQYCTIMSCSILNLAFNCS